MKVCLSCLAGTIALFGLIIGNNQTNYETAVGETPRPESASEQERLQAERSEAWMDGIKQRIAANNQIIEDLAARRLTLLEAAARLQSLYRPAPESQWRLFRRLTPGRSDAERFCRAVIRLTGGYLPEGENTTALVASLDRELQGHLRNGSLRLPD